MIYACLHLEAVHRALLGERHDARVVNQDVKQLARSHREGPNRPEVGEIK